jgi:hypothetical protein
MHVIPSEAWDLSLKDKITPCPRNLTKLCEILQFVQDEPEAENSHTRAILVGSRENFDPIDKHFLCKVEVLDPTRETRAVQSTSPQRLIKRCGFPRDCRPTEFFFDPSAPGLPKFFALLRISH